MMDDSDRGHPIVSTPGVLGGQPRIDGHRIGVMHILGAIEAGFELDEIIEDVYSHLSSDDVEAAVDWIYDHPNRVRDLRLDAIVEQERSRREASKPPMALWSESCPFISQITNGDVPSIVMPDGQYVRVLKDPSTDSYTVYDINLNDMRCSPVMDEPDVTIFYAIVHAEDYADDEGFPIGDQIFRKRSVRLGELP